MIKEATASTFVFREDPGGVWRTALVWHPRLECWIPTGVRSGSLARCVVNLPGSTPGTGPSGR
jgi:hypothetical protein